MPKLNPNELFDLYKNGLPGTIDEPYITEELLTSSKYPIFGDAAKALKGSGKGKLSLPYKSLLKFDKGAFTERQDIGDCVAHGFRNACDISRAVEIDINKEAEDFVARGATEGVFGYRGHGGTNGMSPARGAKFISVVGGILVRKNYGVVDLSKYKSSIGVKWGSRGLPDKVMDIANDNPMQTVSLIRTIEELRDALANGYAVTVGSNYGFTRTRDKKGFCRPSGSWNHMLTFTGCDDTNGNADIVCQNSWGNYVSGPHPEWGTLPMSAFLIKAEVAEGMMKQGAAYCCSNFKGFPAQTLPNFGFDY